MIGLLAGLGAGLFGDWLSARSQTRGATDAAGQQEQYNRQALGYLGDRAQQGRDDLLGFNATGRDYLNPFSNAGIDAISRLSGNFDELTRPFTLADYQADPGRDFRLKEGLDQTAGQFAGTGTFQSGAATRALERYRQNFATSEYENARKRFTEDQNRRLETLFGVGNMGLNAGTTAAGMNQRTGEALLGEALPTAALGGSYLTGIGDSQAAARAARGSAYGNLYGNLGGNVADAITLATLNRKRGNVETLSY